MKKQHVLIVGGGPVGLCMAVGLAHQGIASTVIEKEPDFAKFPKASTIHPPTLEIFEEWGLIDKLLSKGLKARELQYWDRPTKEIIATFNLDLLKDETRYPFRLQLEQSELQVIIEESYRESDHVRIKFQHELLGYEQSENGVTATVKTPDGVVQIESDFLIGADGASSTIRKLWGIEYEGFTYEKKFLVLGIVDHDFKQEYEGLNDVSYFFDPKEFVALIHNHQMWKFMFPLADSVKGISDLSDSFIQEKICAFTGVEKSYNVVHKSVFNVHQRVASKVLDGRVILIGDAAHINNPLGGMGMNSGIHDAYFLSKDLSRVLSEPGQSIQDTLTRFEENRLVAIKEVQKRTVENEKAASKSLDAGNPADKMKYLASDQVLAKQYLMQTSMIDDFNFMLSRNKNSISL